MATSIISQPFSRQYSETGQEICTLCCEEARAWAVSSCEHFVCLTCSARLRVLCDKKECPVCRERNDKVIVYQKPQPFVLPQTSLKDRKYGFIFSKSSLMNLYENIRAICCSHCGSGGFQSMRTLMEHTKREHGLFFCEICLEHLKLFPSEHKLYSRSDLVRHRRVGDPDDHSHKGHPQCEFCDERYFGKDELFFHLKKNHFWCHFCEQQSGNQEYYPNYESLKGHFRSSHFLCEEGACRHEKFTNVFLSRLDLQAHKAKVHTKGLSKSEAKQLRQVDVGFTYTRKERGDLGGRRQYRPAGYSSEQRDLETAINLSIGQSKEQQVEHQGIPLNKGDLKGGGGEGVKETIKESINERTELKRPQVMVERKKPPGLEHVSPTQVEMTGKSKVTEEDDEEKDEWPSLGLESLKTPPPIVTPGQFPWVMVSTGVVHAPVPLPPPGLNPVSVTEFDIKEDAMRLLKHNPEKINYFKVLSGQYQRDEISVKEYSDKCRKLFGPCWKQFGIRLAATLPIMEKRNELYVILANNYEEPVSQSANPPPGFTLQDLPTVPSTSNDSGTVREVYNNPGVTEGKKSNKKRRNRNYGGGITTTTTTPGYNNNYGNNPTSKHVSGSSGGPTAVWQQPTPAVTAGGKKVILKESEFPSLGTAARMSDPVVSVPTWNMKVAVK